MKKILTVLFTLTVALSLAMPAWAVRWPLHLHKHAKSEATENGKAHEQHAKKKGATKGKKQGQEGATPGQANQ